MSGSPTSGSPTWWDLSDPLHWVPTFHWFQPSPSSSFLGQKKIFPLQIFPSFSFSVSSPPNISSFSFSALFILQNKNIFLLQIIFLHFLLCSYFPPQTKYSSCPFPSLPIFSFCRSSRLYKINNWV